jgi:hypothetical protein
MFYNGLSHKGARHSQNVPSAHFEYELTRALIQVMPSPLRFILHIKHKVSAIMNLTYLNHIGTRRVRFLQVLLENRK